MADTDLPDNEKEFVSEGCFDVVAIAASAGGLNAIINILSRLVSGFPAALLVVQHVDPRGPSYLATILGRRTALQVKHAEEGDYLHRGRVFLAPPNYHLSVLPGGLLHLTQTQPVNHVRPSADVLFLSVATCYRERAIGVVLSGSGSDGRDGIQAIHRAGGCVIVQDQETSEVFGMPGAAIHTGIVDYILPIHLIAPALLSLVSTGHYQKPS